MPAVHGGFGYLPPGYLPSELCEEMDVFVELGGISVGGGAY